MWAKRLALRSHFLESRKYITEDKYNKVGIQLTVRVFPKVFTW